MKASSSDNPGQLQDNSVHPQKLPHDVRRNSIDREKKMHTGKVKLLSTEEVIRLTSRAMLPVSPVKDCFHPLTVLRKNRSIKVRNHTAPPKSNSCPISPSELENRFKPPTALRQVAQSSAGRRENDATQPSPEKRMQSLEGHCIMSNIDNADEKGVEIVVEKATIASTTISPLKFDQPIVDSGVVSSTMKIPVAPSRSSSPLIPATKVDKNLYIPASEASWKGSFNLLVCGPKKWEISGVIQAHPPSRVRKKVYESSMLMPEVLEFELVQQGGLWMSLFGNYTPDNRDIGVYLFPSTCQRCKSYTLLLECIGEQDMVLRNYRDGLELLVFTSKILQIDCQRWNGMYFLWGLFRRMEFTTTGVETDMNHCHSEGYNNKAIDMEIDMLGGQNVGRLDVAVPRIPLQLPQPCHINETLSEIPPGFEKMECLTGQGSCAPAASHANETFSEIPPGFEKLHPLKDQDQRWASAAKGGLVACVKIEKPDEVDV